MMKTVTFVIAAVFAGSASCADLRVKVGNIASDDGVVRLALYDSETAYDSREGFVDAIKMPAARGSVEAVFQDLAPGQYVVTVFHDLNDNKVLETGWFGKPQEPFGFSREATGKLGPPAFEDASLDVGSEDVQDTITLQD